MKKRLLSIIIVLLALASGAQVQGASFHVPVYDGETVSSVWKIYNAMLQVIANVEGKMQIEMTSANVQTYKDLNGNTLFSFNTDTKMFSVPADVQPFVMSVDLSDASREALKKVVPKYADYDNILVQLEQVVNEKTFPSRYFREWISDNVCRKTSEGKPYSRLNSNDVYNVENIDVSSIYYIQNLKGIELFPNLKTLDCSHNQITSFDLSKNTKLVKLHCQDNKLTSLKVNSNSLNEIYCFCNNISGSNMDALISSLPTRSNGTFLVKYPSYATTGIDNEMTCKQVSNAIKKGWVPKCEGSGADYLGSDFVCRINSANFEDYQFQKYVRTYFDLDENDMLDQSEIANVTTMGVSNKNFWSLKGIEYFTSLRKLVCDGNKLTSLDLRSNKSLTELRCQNNQLNSLNVSGLKNLQTLLCSGNKLTSLDLSTCTNLALLYCENNQLSSLKMQGGSTKLSYVEVYCFGNKLSGSNMTTFVNSLPTSETVGRLRIKKNEASTGNQITTAQVQTATGKNFDVQIWDSSKQDWVSHSDSHPDAYVITVYDGATLSALDLQILTEMMAFVQPLMIGSLSESDNVYTFFPYGMAHIGFQCNKNTRKCTPYPGAGFAINLFIDVAGYYYMYQYFNTILKDYPTVELRMEVAINSNTFPDTNFRTWVSNNCDTDKNGRLTKSELAQVTSMDVSNKNISNLKGIEYFWELTSLNCSVNNLTSLDLSWQASLTTLNCSGNKLQSLNISSCKALEYLYCDNNKLTSLSLSNNTTLKNLQCQNNQLSSLSVSKNTELVRIMCYGNKIQDANMTSFINSLPQKSDGRLNVYANNSSEGNRISVAQVKVAKEDKGWQVLTSGENPYPGYDALAVNDTNFPDATFKSWVSSNCDIDQDGFLSDEEIAAVTSIEVRAMNISDLKGIEYFTALDYLDCSFNQLTSLNVSNNTKLTYLECIGNQLTSLDVSKNTALTYLECIGNQLTSLDVSKNTALTGLYIGQNLLTSLNVSNNTALTELYCSFNQLTSLDVSKNTALTILYCYDNLLTSLDVKGLYLERLDCGNNRLTSLDLTSAAQLKELDCSGNQLTALVATDCSELKELICYNNKIKGSAFYMPNFIAGDSGEQGRLEFNVPADGNVLTTTKVLRLKDDGWNVLTKIGELSYEEYLGVGGDANYNWVIDEDDVDTMRDHILGSDPSPFSLIDADVNGDGTVDIVDLTLLIQYLTK